MTEKKTSLEVSPEINNRGLTNLSAEDSAESDFSYEHRHYAFTIWNSDTPLDLINWKNISETFGEFGISYLIVGDELGKINKGRHGQGHISFIKKKTFKGAVKIITTLFGEKTANIKKCYKPAIANITYCKKDGNLLIECGKMDAQGERNDLKDTVQQLLNGETTLDEISIKQPGTFNQFQRTFARIESIRFNRNKRTTMTKGYWYYGGTATGKTTRALQGKDDDDVYVHNEYEKNWWDKYRQQKYVLLDDFRGEIPYNTMLKMVDKHNTYSVSRRGKEPINFTSEEVIVTSSLHPAEVYHKRHDKDKLKQLYRRFEIIFCGGRDEYLDHTNLPKCICTFDKELYEFILDVNCPSCN